MIKRTSILQLLFVLTVTTIFACVPAHAQQTKEGLLQAWEQAQKGDPQNKIFEKVSENKYRFVTEHFPYSGHLRVLNVTFDQYGEDLTNGFVMGVVEVELDSMASDFMAKHAYSYGLWQRNNILYFDGKKKIWLSAAEYQKDLTKKYRTCGGSLWTGLLSSFWLWFFILLVIFLFWLSRKTNKQMKTAFERQDKALAESERAIKLSEKAIEISQDSNKILKDILEELKSRKQ
jgi:uncharacterized membrane protein